MSPSGSDVSAAPRCCDTGQSISWESRGPNSSGRTSVVAVAFLIGASLFVSGCGKLGKKAEGPPPVQTPEVAVITLKPTKAVITTELPARTSAYLVAEVRPQVNGIVQRRLFNEGSDVRAGEVLYQIDPAIYQAAFDTAVAALGKAEANLVLAELSFKRSKSLLSTGAVAQEEYDNAAANLQQAHADLAQTSATIATARVNLEFTSVTAPISGRIGKSNVTVGALATSHQGPAFTTIQQLDPIYVDATQSSANLLRVRRNMAAGKIKGDIDNAKVTLALEDGTSYPMEGTLKFSDVTVDPSTGSFILRMVFPNPDHVLLPGMYVRATVEVGVTEDAILVPQRGVSSNTKGQAIAMVVNEANKVEQRILTIDRAIGNKWLVDDGLKTGDRVIVEGLQMVRPGAEVKVVPFVQDGDTTSSAPAGSPAGKAK